MLKMLEDKELYYNDLGSLEVIDIEEESGVERDSRMRRRRRKSSMAGETLYDPSSIDFMEPEDMDFNGLLNRNYAVKQHLPTTNLEQRYY